MAAPNEDTNQNKRPRDDESSDGETVDGMTPGHHTKRFRIQDHPAPQPPSSTSYDLSVNPTMQPPVNLAEIASTMQMLAAAASACVNPEPGIPQPSFAPRALGDSEQYTRQEGRNEVLDVSVPPDSVMAEIQRQLATAWTSKQLQELKLQGVQVKTGKFSDAEKQSIDLAIENYRINNNLDSDGIRALIFKGHKGKGSDFFPEIASAVPERPVQSVYRFLLRDRDPLKHQGEWMNSEDILLKQAAEQHGHHWVQIAKIVGRTDQDCRDRYLNHLASSNVHVSGKWSKDEEEQLTQAVKKISGQEGDIDRHVFWSKVSEAMERKRNRQQCAQKWKDSLRATIKNNGDKKRWNATDSYTLVHRIAALKVSLESEISWKDINDLDWEWSSYLLRKHWVSLKEGVEDFDQKTHSEIISALQATYATPPDQTKRKKRATSYTTSSSRLPEAGSSNGPGILARENSGQ